MALDIGGSLGPYEIRALLGAGGMGRVFRAHDTRLKRDVAIKTLPPEFELDPDRVSRFKREAEALAALSHASIAGIHDLIEVDGSKFLVLELVEGETLADRLQRGMLGWREAIVIARQIAEALEAAHAQGIVHRDLKPANVKITPTGTVKVLDFGLAKMLARDASAIDVPTPNSPTLTSPAMTVRGVILGTAAYMSPEQARGQAVGPQADIWALGCVLFEMLTGQPPFSGPTVTDVIAAVIRSEPDWNTLPEDTPQPLRTLLRRCLHKDRPQRLRDVADVRLGLEDTMALPATSGTRGSARRSRVRLAWIVAAAFALIAVALAALTMRARLTPQAAEVRLSIVTPPTSDPLSVALSPDGSKVVFSGADSGTPRLWLRSLSDTAARPLPGTDRGSVPFWAPDSRSIAFFADGRLKRLDLDGGATRTLAGAPIPSGGTWGSDGSIVFAPDAMGTLFRVSAAGGEVTAVTKLDVQHFSHRAPHFLADGRHFVYFARGAGGGAAGALFVGSLDGSLVRHLRSSDSNGVVSDGHLFYMLEGTCFAQPFDPWRLQLAGEPFIVSESVAMAADRMAFSAIEQRMLAYRTGGASGLQQLVWFDRTGNGLAAIGQPDMSALLNPDLSSDETRVAVNRTLANSQDVWLVDVDRGLFSRFTLDDAVDQVPVWFPDGRRVVFSSNRKGAYDLYEKSTSGAAEERTLLESTQNKFAMDISNDGRLLLYRNTAPNTNWDLWVLPLGRSGPAATPIPVADTGFQEVMGEFSSDGRWIAYQSNESGQYEIYVRSFPGSSLRLQVSTGGGAQPRWRSDGRELYYVALDGRLMAVSLSADGQGRLHAGTPSPLFMTRTPGGPVPIPQKQQYAVSRDGRRFLVNHRPEESVVTPITVVLNWRPPAGEPR